MAQPLMINSSKYNKQGQVQVDGHLWTVVLPGAGTELRLSQAFRNSKLFGTRIELLDKKIEAGTITEEDLDRYEEYCKEFEKNEKVVYDFFKTMFKDETEDNSEVRDWVENTPSAIMMMAFEDIKEQANSEQEAKEESPGDVKQS